MESNQINETYQLMTLEEIHKEHEEEKLERFKKLGIPTLLYAVFYTFFLYQNIDGITMPLWIIATILFSCYALKQFQIQRKKDGIFHIIAMILLGISTAITGNFDIIAMNYIGFFILLLSFLLHTVYDDSNWGIGTYLSKMLHTAMGAMGRFSTPFTDVYSFQKQHRKRTSENVTFISVGLLLSIPIIIILTHLLASADAVFESFLLHGLNLFDFSTNWFGILLLFMFAFLSAYCGITHLVKSDPIEFSASPVRQKITPVIAITFMTPITLLYVLFSLVQIVYLFLGFGHLPNGITYADYARTGFFQLLFVCFLNFVFVLFVQNCVENSRLLLGLLITICTCTFVMIASSAYRMILYIGAYQLTFLRVFVLVALTMIAFLLAGVVISLFKKQFPIFKYSLIVVSILYLAFSFSHVDYFIASYNLSHMEESSRSEALHYIGTLSSDAAPAIADYMEQNKQLKEKAETAYKNSDPKDGDWIFEADEDIKWYLWYTDKVHNLSKNSTFRTFNVSHYIASKALDL